MSETYVSLERSRLGVTLLMDNIIQINSFYWEEHDIGILGMHDLLPIKGPLMVGWGEGGYVACRFYFAFKIHCRKIY